MLSIRFSRVGSKKRPVYRIVVMPKHRDPWAKSNEILGHYDPRKIPKELVIKADRVKYWLEQGAEASDSVWNLLVDEKIVEGKKRTSSHISKKRSAKMIGKEVEAKAKAEGKKASEAEVPAESKESPAEKATSVKETPTEEKQAEA